MPSTVIRSFEYDEESQTLLIVFQSGRRYEYLDVPAELIKELRGAFAKGEFFNKHIRSRYIYRELNDVACRDRRASNQTCASAQRVAQNRTQRFRRN